MRCARCDTENAPDHRFCGGCGAALSLACPTCGKDSLPTMRFCSHCGTSLAPAASPPPVTRVATGGELKQISILFADVAGSTSAIEELDPEDAGQRLAPALAAMQAAVRRFEGSVVRVQGDGIMALFGTPQPQEDHAVRACCAGLAMQAAVKELGEAGLPIRVGIHTGEVLARTVSTDISTDFDVADTSQSDREKKHHLEGNIGAGGPLIELTTRNGGIHLRKSSSAN